MRSIARKTIGALCCFVVSGAFAQTIGVVPIDQLTWKAAPADLPPGAEIAVLFGDPAQAGPFVVRVRAPRGYQVPPHAHAAMETLTVLSGVLRYGQGRQLDPSVEKFIPAGGFAVTPADAAHWVVVNDDAVVQLSGTGPWKIMYLDPRDDPRTSASR